MHPMSIDFEPAERGLRDHVAVWRRRIGVIVLLTGVCGAAALATSLLQTPRFQASAQVLVPVEPAGQPGQSDVQNRFDPNRVVQTEAAFAMGDQVQRAAEAKVGADGSVTARGAKDSDIITITATAGTADRAAVVANAYADAYVALRQQPDGIEGVLVIEPARPPAGPASPATSRNVALALAFGLALGLAAAYMVDHFDDVVRGEDDLARLVGLPVLGSVSGPGSSGSRAASTVGTDARPAHVVDAHDDLLLDTEIKALLGDAPNAKVLVVPVGARGRDVRPMAQALRNAGAPAVGAVLSVLTPGLEDRVDARAPSRDIDA